MYKQLTILIMAFGCFLTCLATESLSDTLREKLQPCMVMFDDLEPEDRSNFMTRVDDPENRYYHVSGMWPPCGCECSMTVKAYRYDMAEYLVMTTEKHLCDWVSRVTFDRDPASVLPDNFGVQTFIPNWPEDYSMKHTAFYLDMSLPQTGTDTVVTIKPVPFGLHIKSGKNITWETSQGENSRPLYAIRTIAQRIADETALVHVMTGQFDRVNDADMAIVRAEIGETYGKFESMDILQKHLNELSDIYMVYSRIPHKSVVFGWNAQEGTFFLKERGDPVQRVTFREFLIENEYWSVAC